MNDKATNSDSNILGNWRIFLIAIVLLLLSGGCLYFALKTWTVVTLVCLGFVFVCYGLVLQFCPPQPLLLKREPSEIPSKSKTKAFSFREIPIMIGGMLIMAWFSPWLLMVALFLKIGMRFQWRRQFPNASKTEIQDFLNGLARSLGLESARSYFISPNDKLIKVYESIYVIGDTPDKVEIEKIIHHLQVQYGIDFRTLWRKDMTIGELYAHAKGISH